MELIKQLGDAKFVGKLSPIFESLDKVIAGSQVVQLLVQYGLEDRSAGKTCKNESLQLIEKAYRKRGSILRIRDDKAFYEAVARCISDSGTRNEALSLMVWVTNCQEMTRADSKALADARWIKHSPTDHRCNAPRRQRHACKPENKHDDCKDAWPRPQLSELCNPIAKQQGGEGNFKSGGPK